ncbi:MAG TPA: PEP-CTERM sorting domain-containing protein [Verrucomicrobiae bacterium]|nr:PEP-CTERM sorting domain-containing protein [Verrucomicrobiae bacterium]
MKKLTKASLLVGGAVLASQLAFAQNTFIQNDLYLGFQNSSGGGSADYLINLGAASGIIGQSSVVDLSSDISLSLFNSSSLQGTASRIFGGVVGAANAANNGGTADVFGTTLRTSNIGDAALAGSFAPAGATKQSIDNGTETALSQINAPSAGTGLLDGGKSWEAYVEPAFTTSSFYGNAGFNPDSQVSTSTVLYEDLWETSDSGDPRGSAGQPYNYLGYFTLDLTGSSPALTFTGANVAAVPEPATCGILAGGGVLLLALRRRIIS